LIEENNLDPNQIKPTGKDGRLTKGDILAALEAGTAKVFVQPSMLKVENNITTLHSPRPEDPREERVKMNRLRQAIARRLKESQNTAAMLTTYNEADMSAVMELRSEYRETFEKKHGVRLGFMSFFVKACVNALKEIPAVNAEIHNDEIIYKNYYDIGVAVGTPQGLVVPILRDANELGFAGLEKSINNLGARARDGKLTLEDMTGGTFTISNGGVYGSLMSSPILNPPQSGILGMHKIQPRPIAVNGAVEIRPMMYLALSYDHRIVDGREAVTFLVRIKEAIEDPRRLLLDM
jgi:2-oxoglutarate dehydrogenase E2 component (dihydrolipoamide succinyltransferase)